MEINTTCQTVKCIKNLYSSTVELQQETEIILPDYCKEITKALKCTVNPQIYNKKVTENEIIIEGISSICLIYGNTENNISCYNQELPFKKTIPFENSVENPICDVKITVDYINCRPSSPKKANLNFTLNITPTVYFWQNNNIITDVDMDGIQLKREFVNATNTVGNSEKAVVVEEELPLDNTDVFIDTVFRKSVTAVIDECSLLGNKAVVKGNIIVTVLFCDNNGCFNTFSGKIPFNQLLDISIEGEECKVMGKANVLSYNIIPKANISGEAKSFLIEAKIVIKAIASCEADLPSISDIYNIKNNIQTEFSNIPLKKLQKNIYEKYLCEKKLEFSENTFGKVIDIWCENSVNSTKIINGELTIEGALLLCMLTKNAEGEPEYSERNIDYLYTLPVGINIENIYPEAQVNICSISYTITSDSTIEIRVELSVNASIFSSCMQKTLCGLTECEGECKNKKAPIIVYFPQENESIWNIAKRYNSDYEKTKELNNIENDNALNDMIILP